MSKQGGKLYFVSKYDELLTDYQNRVTYWPVSRFEVWTKSCTNTEARNKHIFLNVWRQPHDLKPPPTGAQQWVVTCGRLEDPSKYDLVNIGLKWLFCYSTLSVKKAVIICCFMPARSNSRAWPSKVVMSSLRLLCENA
jgi:hypothetical protein